jgi:7,8-dihydropterin-6-yl-methyl-4-(beta-D-ribofuranosyl)aminobenzene 5'-phosphate synthase
MKPVLLTIWILFAVLLLTPGKSRNVADTVDEQSGTDGRVRSLRVLVLSTMLAERGIGEWGFSALVEVDGRRILFDTGAHPDTVLRNARDLGINLTGITDVILSHNHPDHTGGLLHLRRELSKENPAALSRVHVGQGIFWSRPRRTSNEEGNSMIALKPSYEATGGTFVEHKQPIQLYPGVWLTGPVRRTHSEQKGGGWGLVKAPEGSVEDYVPEDMSLVFDTAQGLVVLSGCGHAGLINTLEHARDKIRRTPAYAIIGGFHLFSFDDAKLDWTGDRLREFGIRHILGAHCTGIEAVYRLRQRAGLDRQSCVVSAVGSSFSLDKGIDPLTLAR